MEKNNAGLWREPDGHHRAEPRHQAGAAVPQHHVADSHLCFHYPGACSPSHHQATHGLEELSEDTDEYDYFDYTRDLEQPALPRFWR
ncbi:hypothetical protein U9M48_037244 [Paspalum notatum var. saurae]|uniref:Uncharacterized protein n=1 Tax=Paspalum notatum var. saurae TaxID=547442 RepID=A0AAQ3X930_PASNO